MFWMENYCKAILPGKKCFGWRVTVKQFYQVKNVMDGKLL
jgi:hypothetical protein